MPQAVVGGQESVLQAMACDRGVLASHEPLLNGCAVIREPIRCKHRVCHAHLHMAEDTMGMPGAHIS